MIRIGKPFTRAESGRAYLCAPVDISDDTAARYLEVTATLKNTAWLSAISRGRTEKTAVNVTHAGKQ